MGRPFRIARIFGIPIKVDVSWLFIVFLLTSSLAMAYSQDFPYLSWPLHVVMGLVGSLLLFGSVLAHELSHALVALRNQIPIRGITLFIFGGAAELGDEPPNASAELKVAVAGPAMSLVLAAGFLGVYTVGLGRAPASAMEIVWYLALMNGILVAFNLVPGFPLDGGRVLRAALWGIWGDLRTATRTASSVGSGFGLLIVFLGFLSMFGFNNLIGGVWYIFIGLFLRNAARASYQQMLLKESLSGIKAVELMDEEAVVVAPHVALDDLVHGVMMTSGRTELPVVDGGRLLGRVGLRQVRRVDRSQWPHTRVADVMARDVARRSVSASEDASRVLSLAAVEEGFLAVVEGDRFLGVVTPQDVLRRVQLRMELRADLQQDRGYAASARVGEHGDARHYEGDGDEQGNHQRKAENGDTHDDEEQHQGH